MMQGTRQNTQDPNKGRVDLPQSQSYNNKFVQGTAEQKTANTDPQWSEIASPMTEALASMASRADNAGKEAKVTAKVAQLGGDVAVSDIKGTEQRTGAFGKMFGQSVTRRAVQQQEVTTDLFEDTLNQASTMEQFNSTTPSEWSQMRQDQKALLQKKYKGDNETLVLANAQFDKDTFQLAQMHRKAFDTETMLRARNQTTREGRLGIEALGVALDNDTGENTEELNKGFVGSLASIGGSAVSGNVRTEVQQEVLIGSLEDGNIAAWRAVNKHGKHLLQNMDQKKLATALSAYDTKHSDRLDGRVSAFDQGMEDIIWSTEPIEKIREQVWEQYAATIAELSAIEEDSSDTVRTAANLEQDEAQAAKIRNKALRRLDALAEKAAKGQTAAEFHSDAINFAADWREQGASDTSTIPVGYTTKYPTSSGTDKVLNTEQWKEGTNLAVTRRLEKFLDGADPSDPATYTNILATNPDAIKEVMPLINQGGPSPIVDAVVRSIANGWQNDINEDDNQLGARTRMAVNNLMPLVRGGYASINGDDAVKLQLIELGIDGSMSAEAVQNMFTKYEEAKGDENYKVPFKDTTRQQYVDTIIDRDPNNASMRPVDRMELYRKHNMLYKATGNNLEASNNMLGNILQTGYKMIGGVSVRNGHKIPPFVVSFKGQDDQVFSFTDVLGGMDTGNVFGDIVRRKTGMTTDTEGNPVKFATMRDLEIDYDEYAKVVTLTSPSLGFKPVAVPWEVFELYAKPALENHVSAQQAKKAKREASLYKQRLDMSRGSNAAGWLKGLSEPTINQDKESIPMPVIESVRTGK